MMTAINSFLILIILHCWNNSKHTAAPDTETVRGDISKTLREKWRSARENASGDRGRHRSGIAAEHSPEPEARDNKGHRSSRNKGEREKLAENTVRGRDSEGVDMAGVPEVVQTLVAHALPTAAVVVTVEGGREEHRHKDRQKQPCQRAAMCLSVSHPCKGSKFFRVQERFSDD